MSTILKQPVHIDNRVGASGTLATEFVAREKPDGYTLLWTISNHATNHELFKVNYDPIKDFVPVASLSATSCNGRGREAAFQRCAWMRSSINPSDPESCTGSTANRSLRRPAHTRCRRMRRRGRVLLAANRRPRR